MPNHQLLNNVTHHDVKIITDYSDSNCFNRELDEINSKFLKYTPNKFFVEVDLFTDGVTLLPDEEGRN